MLYEEFIANAIPCFPLHAVKFNPDGDPRCACPNPNCTNPGKHPAIMDWVNTPLYSDDELCEIEDAGGFSSGYGVLMSGGLMVVDVDARNGGIESLGKLMEAVPDLKSLAGLMVNTGSGSGSMHLYFRTPNAHALVSHHKDYPGIDFKSSGFVVGPGSLHASGERYEIHGAGHPSEISEPPAELLALLARPKTYRVNTGQKITNVTDQDIREMLDEMDPNCSHDEWVEVGFAIHHATGGAGYDLWDEWSAQAAKGVYPGSSHTLYRWSTFSQTRDNPVTIASLIKASGWSRPVVFSSEPVCGADEEPESRSPGLDSVDLLRPPGFVGEICAWINSRSLYPRETLAVAAALSVVSSVAGMRYRDESGRLAINTFMFCVAKSGTGKQSILDCTNDLLQAAGVGAAVYGNFKSEQEIFRNLCSHQAAYYVIDELGEVLQKVTGSKGPGGQSYLAGIISQLMSIFSKSHSTVNLTGDLKRSLGSERAAAYKALLDKYGENPDDPAHKAKLKRAKEKLAMVQDGLKNPYLTIMGLTTPETFDGVMTPDLILNGFVARTIIFRELEDNPKMRPYDEIAPKGVPNNIAMRLMNMYGAGTADNREVRKHGDSVTVKMTPEAKAMVEECKKYFWDMAELHKNTTGMTPIPRRGLEMTLKTAMVLAADEEQITPEHVKWAWAIIDHDIKGKITLALENDQPDEGSTLLSKVLSLVTKTHGEMQGKIRNACRKWDKDDVDRALDYLVKNGKLRVETTVRNANKYYLA